MSEQYAEDDVDVDERLSELEKENALLNGIVSDLQQYKELL